MVSIIKNQLLKHLSRYTKNLSLDKINISTFRGEGELSNLQLDENVLTELLELPAWLKLTSAWCNHVSFRISWTKLKSVPIVLSLDEVNITLETCELGRTSGTSSSTLPSLSAAQGKYSFTHKVIDGITVLVNTVNVHFKSPAFTASALMSRIRVESKTPKWLVGDLRVTRLKDPVRGQILIFKELSWQTVRIEASSTQDKTLTPLRLLTNQAKCRITIKKKLQDCSIISSCLVLILDDLLWVLTDSQLKAALHFVESLAALIQKSTQLTRKSKAQKKLETLPDYQIQILHHSDGPSVTKQATQISPAQKSFNMFDVRETSYHFFSQRIDLHLCDDVGPGRSSHPNLSDGGALQISVQGFQIDYYPFHLAKSDRTQWPKYRSASIPPAIWLEESLKIFKESLLKLNKLSTNGTFVSDFEATNSIYDAYQKKVLENFSRLMTACIVLRIDDFDLYRVTTSGRKQMPKELISSDKDRYSFPSEMSTLHAEFTHFYYPGDFVFPLPPSKIFIHVNPVQINFHLDSILWLNSFALNLHESLLRTGAAAGSLNQSMQADDNDLEQPSLIYMDVKMEAIMPRIIFESNSDSPPQRDRPKVMQIQISRFALTNIRETGSSRADLAQALHSLQEGSLVFGSTFPSQADDLCIVTDRILSHVSASDVVPARIASPDSPGSDASMSSQNFSRYALWAEPRDIWCIKFDPIWIDFIGARSFGTNKSVPFIDAVPIALWIHIDQKSLDSKLPTNHPKTNNIMKQPNDQTLDELFLSLTKLPSLDDKILFDTQCSYVPFENSHSSHPSIASDIESNDSNSVSTNPTIINDPNRSQPNNSADINIIAHIQNLISIQIDHYQLLFLLRLSEELTELSTFISIDSTRILDGQSNSKNIVVGGCIPQIEITLVMPSQTPGKESTSGADAESVLLPDSVSLVDDLQPNSLPLPLHFDAHQQSQYNPNRQSIETPSPVTESQLLPNDITPALNSTTATPSHNRNNILTMPIVTPSRKGRNSIADASLKDIGSSFISMKKGFSNFMSSIDGALKQSTDDVASDTFSIQSDLSSDSENMIMVLDVDDKPADCMDVMFRLNPFTNADILKVAPVELASEVSEDEQPYKTNDSSPSDPSEASLWKRKDLVSMATFRLTNVEVIRQNSGYKSSLLVQISAITNDECGAMPWDELQTKFGARCRAWNIAPFNRDGSLCIQLRLDEVLTPPTDLQNITNIKKTIPSWFARNVDIRVKDLTMDLAMSTMIGISELTEDEVIARPLPMKCYVSNIKLNLTDDRPPVNITSPGNVPVNLEISNILIIRDDTGTFKIQPNDVRLNKFDEPVRHTSTSDRSRELLSLQLVLQQLKLDHNNLKSEYDSLEKSYDLNRQSQNETEQLKGYLKKAQDNITTLLDEKQTLLNTIRSLQAQLVSSTSDHAIKQHGNR